MKISEQKFTKCFPFINSIAECQQYFGILSNAQSFNHWKYLKANQHLECFSEAKLSQNLNTLIYIIFSFKVLLHKKVAF